MHDHPGKAVEQRIFALVDAAEKVGWHCLRHGAIVRDLGPAAQNRAAGFARCVGWPGIDIWRLMNRVMRQLQSHRSLAATDSRPAPNQPVRLSIHFFAIAIFFFALGTASAPWATVKLADYFYQLPVLAWVHTFTLGWITSAILGVMYRYVPAMTNRELRFPRMANVQLVLYFLGASGVVAHFMLGSWDGVWMAGAVIALSVVLFAINIVPCLAPQFGRGAAETGMLMAIFFLFCAGCLGSALAFDKGRSFMSGTLLRNLSAHAHLAVLGWVTLTICAVSYRFMTALMGEKAQVPRSALLQLFALAAATIVLFTALLAGAWNVTAWAVVTGIALGAYAVIFPGLIASRSGPLDWTMGHVLAAMVCLVLSIIAGIALAQIGVGSPFGARLACAYGVLGLLGWVSNFIVGMSYQLFTGFVARARSALGWPYLSIAELSISRGRPLVFCALNSGVLLMAGGLLADRATVAIAGASLIALAGLVYSAAMAWTLSFAYRRATPPDSTRILRVLPE